MINVLCITEINSKLGILAVIQTEAVEVNQMGKHALGVAGKLGISHQQHPPGDGWGRERAHSRRCAGESGG